MYENSSLFSGLNKGKLSRILLTNSWVTSTTFCCVKKVEYYGVYGFEFENYDKENQWTGKSLQKWSNLRRNLKQNVPKERGAWED